MSALDKSLGVIFIGVTVGGILWGISVLQIFQYYTTRPKDSLGIKCMVALLGVCTSTHQLLMYSLLYSDAVTNFGKIEFLYTVPVWMAEDFATTPIIAGIVQGLYIFKIWKLSKGNWLVTLPIVILGLAQTGLGFWVVSIATTTERLWSALLVEAHKAVLSMSTVSAALDVAITITMCSLLQGHRSEYARTSSVIGKIIAFTISTNMLTALVQLAIFVVYLIYPKEIYPVAMYSVVPQLYSVSFMAALNMRPYLKQNVDQALVNSDSFPMVGSPRNQAHFANVNIFKETVIRHDSRRDNDKDEMQWDGAERV